MVYSINSAFDAFHDSINITGDHRETCRARKEALVAHLKKTLTVSDSFQAGSIPRYTALKSLSDLDVMVILNYGLHCKDQKPSAVLATVRKALSDYGQTNVRRNGQAVTVKYQTWPDVDIVPVYRVMDGDTLSHYCIPDMNTEQWIEARPVLHGNQIDGRATSVGPEFRKIIKMMKWWNSQNGDYLRSYHIEALAVTYLASFSDWPWTVYQFIKTMHENISSSSYSPCLYYEGNYADSYLTGSDRSAAISKLAYARSEASDAWYATCSQNNNQNVAIAIGHWRNVFGTRFPSYG